MMQSSVWPDFLNLSSFSVDLPDFIKEITKLIFHMENKVFLLGKVSRIVYLGEAIVNFLIPA